MSELEERKGRIEQAVAEYFVRNFYLIPQEVIQQGADAQGNGAVPQDANTAVAESNASPQLDQLLAQMPDELKQQVIQAIQNGTPPEQALKQAQQQLQ